MFVARKRRQDTNTNINQSENYSKARITSSAHDPSIISSERASFSRVHPFLYAISIRQSSIVNSTAWQPRHGDVETSQPVIHVHLRRAPRATTNVLHRLSSVIDLYQLRTTSVYTQLRSRRVDYLVQDKRPALQLFCGLPSRRNFEASCCRRIFILPSSRHHRHGSPLSS